LVRRAYRPIHRPSPSFQVIIRDARFQAIKRSLGKLDAPDDLEAAMQANRFLPLPVTVPHALTVQTLPDQHRDPFDRLLIAQAQHEGFKLVSRDPHIPRYGVPHIVA
jgi:PIN domain nuclease of toxin-antitoxin system